MQIVLIRKDEISKTVLPSKVSGQHRVFFNVKGDNKPLFAVSANDGSWVIKENKKIELLDGFRTDAHGNKEISLKENEFYPIRYKANDERLIVLIEPISSDRSSFDLYQVPANGIINVGQGTDNEISFNDDLLSETVGAQIVYDTNGNITVKDSNSINGIYLNNKRVTESVAHFGDELYLVGLRVIFGKGFIAINNPGNTVTVSLSPVTNSKFELKDSDEEDEEVANTFSSAPRFKRSISKKKITIEAPPKPADNQNMPWAVVMGPSITMAFGSVFSAVFTIQNIMRTNGDISTALPTLVMSVCMVLGTIVWPIFAKRFEKRSRIAKESLEKREYLAYLEKVQKEIRDEIADQEKIIRQNNPSIEDCISRINGRKMTLWERSPRHDDFLEVMVGMGDIPAEIELSYQQKSAIEKSTESADAMYKLVETKRTLTNVPVTIPFAKSKIVGVIGERSDVISMAKAMLIELTALHNYNDLKIIFIYDEKERQVWNFVKWIPHAWNNDKNVRYIANDIEEAKELSNFISNIQAIYENDKENNEDKTHYLIVAADRVLADKIQSLKEFTQNPAKYNNISMLALYDERKFLPKSCSTICSIENSKVTLADFNNITDKPLEIENAISYNDDPEDIFVNMANIELDIIGKDRLLPTELTYFEMFESGKPEHLDVLSHWEENDPVKSLAAPIGIDADGYTIKLDIHEKAHGPHGLIAGMTGSGKSEFIISYIASMAVNYSPEEVAFVLIDFKGGGMADVFKNLPHLAGSITNLDGNELQRSFIAIESELEKRQALFKEISEKKKISNIDIYKYQKLRKEDKTLKPLPHLVIISDEFAELKQQHADFMEQLIRIARIGRSLGVHLILATQKPDGVVDDQIKSNIKFKICLKVQDKSDSQSVIGRPDATMITNAGRFYLQVGYNELFEYGQSPWSGAPYYPSDQYRQTNSKRIDVLNEQGRVIYKVKPQEPPRPAGVPEKQIDALVDYLREFSDTKGYVSEKLWLEPLKGPVEEKKKVSEDSTDVVPFVLNPVIGMYDDLKNQKHKPLTVPMTDGGNTIVYGASGSGKLSFLNQLMVSLIERHSPEEVTIYAIDFDSGSLSAFAKAPHVGKIVLSNEFDALQAVFEKISSELDNRKELFKKYGGDYQNYVRNSGKTVPNIVLVISNFLAFTEEYDRGEELIAKIAREGKKYGVFVVLSAMNASSVRYALVPLFTNLFVLQQNNDDQYDTILGKTGGITPSKFKGRGIFKKGEITYEFQTNIAFEDKPNIYEAIDKFCESIAEKSDYAKDELKVLPPVVTKEYFEQLGLDFSMNSLPVAVDVIDKEPVLMDLTKNKLTAIAYGDEDKASESALFNVIAQQEEISFIVDAGNTLKLSDERVIRTKEQLEQFVDKIENEVFSRATDGQKALADGKPLPDFKHIYVLIKDYHTISALLTQEVMNRLNAVIAGITDNYHIHFIITENVGYAREILEPGALGEALPVTNGITLGDDVRGQRFFDSEVKFSASCEKGQGYVVIGNRARFGKILANEEEVE